MKKPFLTLTVLTFSFAAASAFAGGPGELEHKPAPKKHEKAERGWHKIERGGEEVGDGIEDFFEDVSNGFRTMLHNRHELDALPHLVVLSKGNGRNAQVQVGFCKPFEVNGFHPFMSREKKGKRKVQACKEMLTKGSFNISELRSCTARHSRDENGVARNLQRQLGDIIESGRDPYAYDFKSMQIGSSRDDYRKLFSRCGREIAARHGAPAKPRVAKPAAPKKPAVTVEVIEKHEDTVLPVENTVEVLPAPAAAPAVVEAAPAAIPAPVEVAPPAAPAPTDNTGAVEEVKL